MAEALKRYPLDLDSLDFTNNGLKAKECIALTESIAGHMEQLKSLNFSFNRIGIQGSEFLGREVARSKLLRTLDVSNNCIGDLGVNEIAKGISNLIHLEHLNLSNNALGKTGMVVECMENLTSMLKSSPKLRVLDMSWNNLKGPAAEVLISGIGYNASLAKVNLSYNLLGTAGEGGATAAMAFADALLENQTLQELDLSHNVIEAKSAFCLAFGLRLNTSLRTLRLEGNPIGSLGVRYLIKAMNENRSGKLKELNVSDTEHVVKAKQHFDPANPEKLYTLDLESTYDKVVLELLLDIDERVVLQSEGELQLRDCFVGAKLGNSAWTAPTERNKHGLWEPAADAKGPL